AGRQSTISETALYTEETKKSPSSEFLDRYFLNDPELLGYAMINADCDRTLFDLFLEDIAPPDLPAEATIQSLMIAKQNLQNGLDIAARIFDEITGDKCAMSLKLIDTEHETDSLELNKLIIRT